jgi:hypothetical protein
MQDIRNQRLHDFRILLYGSKSCFEDGEQPNTASFLDKHSETTDCGEADHKETHHMGGGESVNG